MTQRFLLFDMDGVLLKPMGYHKSLQTSVHRIGMSLGLSETNLNDEQIAHFEALNVTNEWDTLAICTAMILIHVWKYNENIRLDGLLPRTEKIAYKGPDFDSLLDILPIFSALPGNTTYQSILDNYPWLNADQQAHLRDILFNCRDINNSLTLPSYQETVLGSKTFQKNYDLLPQLNIESYLLLHDQALVSQQQKMALEGFLQEATHYAGIMTNRPSQTPPGYRSSPEAELGAKLVGLTHLPLLGSGMLAWFATNQCQLPDHTFLKPNPVHSIALLQMCRGVPPKEALELAYNLWRGTGEVVDWIAFDGANVTVFEDAAKGLLCAELARDILKKLGVTINLTRIGVTNNPIKRAALENISDKIIQNINEIDWYRL